MMREKLWFDVEIFIVDDSKFIAENAAVKRAVKEISCALIKHVHLSDNMPPLWRDDTTFPCIRFISRPKIDTRNTKPLSTFGAVHYWRELMQLKLSSCSQLSLDDDGTINITNCRRNSESCCHHHDTNMRHSVERLTSTRLPCNLGF